VEDQVQVRTLLGHTGQDGVERKRYKARCKESVSAEILNDAQEIFVCSWATVMEIKKNVWAKGAEREGGGGAKRRQ
jgi:hypothetical protein